MTLSYTAKDMGEIIKTKIICFRSTAKVPYIEQVLPVELCIV